MSLARTQVQIPRFRAGLIERRELEARLDAALAACRLVLLVAPAGYGKTAVLSRQLQQLPADCAVAWVALGAEDDLESMLLHLTEALEPYDPPWQMAPEALVRIAAKAADQKEAADTLLATLAATGTRRGVLALDDLHAVTDSRVFEFLGLLIDGLPAHWSLAIATRVDPLLSLARLRARREVAEFRQDALSFTVEEVERLCHTADGIDDPAVAHQLHERTQGWAAGLCLSMDAGRGRGAPAWVGERRSRSHLFDYLASEVFDQMPQDLRDFLLRCSVLGELTASRCAAVSGNPRAGELLEEVERRGLFVSLLEADGEVLTLRLHELFRDFLEAQLRRRHADEVPDLLRRAALGERDPVRKLQLLLRASAWPEAEQQLAGMTSRMLPNGDHTQVMRLVELFPAASRARSPYIAYAQGLCAWHHYGEDETQRAMHRAASGFDRLERPVEAQHARAYEALSLLLLSRTEEARSLAAVVRARPMDLDTEVLGVLFDCLDFGFHGPALGAAERFGKVVDLLLSGAPADLWYRCVPRLYPFVSRVGMAAQVSRFVQEALAAAGDDVSLRTTAMMLEGWRLLWQGRIFEALAAAEVIQEDHRWLGQPESLRLPALNLIAACHAARGDRERTRGALRDLALASPPTSKLLELRLAIIFFVTSLMANDWKAARTALVDVERFAQITEGAYLEPQVNLWRAIRAFREGRIDEALEMLRKLVLTSSEVDRMGLDAAVRMLLALAELRSGRPDAAWQSLAPLVARFGAEGEVLDVLVLGGDELAELAQAPWGAAAPPDGVVALRHWADFARRLRATAEVPDSHDARSALSARELQVLERLAAGESNKLIARGLDLSPHTVKRHVARILRRLGVSSRTEASAWHARIGPG